MTRSSTTAPMVALMIAPMMPMPMKMPSELLAVNEKWDSGLDVANL